MSIEDLTHILRNMTLGNGSATSPAGPSQPSMFAAKEIAATLKTFSGKSEHLESFINNIDRFFNRYGRTQDNSLSEFVYLAICSKIIGEAGDFLACRPDLDTWPQIRDALRLKYGDRVDRNVLQQQFLFLTKNKNESVIDFLERLKTIKMRLNLKINSDSNLSNEIKQLMIQQNEVSAVTVLLSNVHSELRTLLMISNTKTIDDATTLVLNHSLMEQQINYRPSHSNPRPSQPMNRPVRQQYYPPGNSYSQHFPQTYYANEHRTISHNVPQTFTPSNNFKPPQQSSFYNRPSNSFPSQPINLQPRQLPPKRYFTNEQVFGKPKNVFAPKNSHKPPNRAEPMSITMNTRLSQNRQNTYEPEPMSTTTNFNRNSRPNAFLPSGPRNFISEELFNLEHPSDESISPVNPNSEGPSIPEQHPHSDSYYPHMESNYSPKQSYTASYVESCPPNDQFFQEKDYLEEVP